MRAERESLASAPRGPRSSPTPPAPAAPAATRDVLALQRTVGNRAVARVLGRQPKPKSPKAPKPAKTDKGGPSLTLADLGTFPVESMQFGSDRQGIGGGSGGGPVSHRTVAVTIPGDAENLNGLFEAAAKGTPIATGTLRMRGLTVTLSDVVIGSFSYSAGGVGGKPVVMVTLEAAKTEVEYDKQ